MVSYLRRPDATVVPYGVEYVVVCLCVCVACMLPPCVGFVCFRPLLSVITSTFDTTQSPCWGRVGALRTPTTPCATTPRSKRILLLLKLAFGRSRLSRIDPTARALPQGGARNHLCSERASVISSAVMRDTKEPPGHPGLFCHARRVMRLGSRYPWSC